jgi:hypothetical protein
MYQRMGKNERTTEPQISLGSEPQKMPHQRSDSVIQAEDVMLPEKEAEMGTITPVEDAEKSEATAATAANGSVDGAQAAKKSKKKSKKKSSIVF